MKYSRKQITKVGNILITTKDNDLFSKSLLLINDWRSLHSHVVQELIKEIINIFKLHGVTYNFYSSRIKRLISILNKIDLNEHMGLGGMQDIGGVRFVFSSIEDVYTAYRCLDLQRNNLQHFTFIKCNDYIIHPKQNTGYRSIHIVYEYKNTNEPDYDGLRVELQIRTRLQHCWATAVETAELISDSALKSGEGKEEWLHFFRIVSAIFSIKEKSPIIDLFNNFSSKDICKEYREYNHKYNFIDHLQALRLSVKNAETEDTFSYYLLTINFRRKIVNINGFAANNDDMYSNYLRIEKSIASNKDAAVVLVSVSRMKELKRAYQSYFLDTSTFIKELNRFDNEDIN